MLLPSLLTLAIALVAICVTTNATDEIAQLAATLTAGFCLLLSLIFAPWSVKLLLLIAIPLTQKYAETQVRETFRHESSPAPIKRKAWI